MGGESRLFPLFLLKGLTVENEINRHFSVNCHPSDYSLLYALNIKANEYLRQDGTLQSGVLFALRYKESNSGLFKSKEELFEAFKKWQSLCEICKPANQPCQGVCNAN